MRFFCDSYLKPAAVIIAALVFAGLLAMPEKKLLKSYNPDAVDMSSLKSTTGGGMLFGVLGGYRSLIADFVWIKSHIEWERKDLAGCMSSIELATSIDPNMIIFWTQGASMIAFDTPHWLYQQIPAEQRTPERLRMFKQRQGETAIKFLDRGLAIFPDNYDMLVQKGQVAIGMDDYALAEECFAKAASAPDAFRREKRIYASLLMKNGKYKAALEEYKKIFSELEPDSPLIPVLKGEIADAEAMVEKTK